MKSVIAAIILSLGSLAHATTEAETRQAVCLVKSTSGQARVTIDLTQDYRYWSGSKSFKINGVDGGSIQILTWSGAREQVAQNTFEIAGVKLENADMSASVATGSFSYSVSCILK